MFMHKMGKNTKLNWWSSKKQSESIYSIIVTFHLIARSFSFISPTQLKAEKIIKFYAYRVNEIKPFIHLIIDHRNMDCSVLRNITFKMLIALVLMSINYIARGAVIKTVGCRTFYYAQKAPLSLILPQTPTMHPGEIETELTEDTGELAETGGRSHLGAWSSTEWVSQFLVAFILRVYLVYTVQDSYNYEIKLHFCWLE